MLELRQSARAMSYTVRRFGLDVVTEIEGRPVSGLVAIYDQVDPDPDLVTFSFIECGTALCYSFRPDEMAHVSFAV